MPDAVSKAVLVTGCSTGIGRATAEHLVTRGWRVYATARKVDAIRDLGGRGCKLLALDVCDESSIRAAVAAIESAEGAVGVLVNNAGYGQEGPVEEVPMEEVRRQFETNFFGLTRLTQLVLPGMRRQRWGKIVNLSSSRVRSRPASATRRSRASVRWADRSRRMRRSTPSSRGACARPTRGRWRWRREARRGSPA